MWEGKQLGPFLVEKEIGAGAMGTVYRALYTKTKKRVAIKVVSVDLQKNPKALARFERETIILKKLDHPNIVKLYASGHAGNRPFYAMEYIDGETLEHVLQRRTRHTWEEVIRLGQQICAALQHAHQQSVIHRDLKPANIMITRDGTVKLTDFGIAKGFELEQLTATNAAIGTASYMSPEQCRGDKNLSHKSDLYSLGVLLYELLVGKRPFRAETTLDMYLQHVEGKFERPSRIVLDIPIWLDTLVCQLLEKEPAKRPFDAATVAQALANIQDKIETRRSAGVDVVTGKASDKPRTDFAMDDTDHDAAQTLKAGIRRKKRKRKPLMGSVALQAVGYSTLLALLIGLGWWFMRPPSAESLYAEAKKLMETGNFDKQQTAREGPIKKYLELYGAGTDRWLDRMQAFADAADLTLKERQLEKRMQRKMSPNSDAETAAQSALLHETEGDLNAAREDWLALEPYQTSKDAELRPYGLVAVRHRGFLDQVAQRRQELAAAVEAARKYPGKFTISGEPEKLTFVATHVEKFGDIATALDKWTKIRSLYETDAEKRIWFLLAAQSVRELKNQKSLRREDFVKKKLAEVKDGSMTKEKALEACVDIRILYQDEPEMADLVREAEETYKKLRAEK